LASAGFNKRIRDWEEDEEKTEEFCYSGNEVGRKGKWTYGHMVWRTLESRQLSGWESGAGIGFCGKER
jgi:hypothetical protein